MTEELIAAVSDILSRGNDISEWPEDEQNLHINVNWGSFTERHEAVIRYRAQKIIRLVISNTLW